MTDLAGMPSYFWLTSSRLRKPLQDDVPYTTQALREDLLRVRNAWENCQASRARDAIYGYLSAVFDLVMRWAAEVAPSAGHVGCCGLQGHRLAKNGRAVRRGHPVHRGSSGKSTSEPEANGRACCDMRRSTRRDAEPLAAFVQRKGGINSCAGAVCQMPWAIQEIGLIQF